MLNRYKMRRVMRGAMRSKTMWLGLALAILGVVYENFSYIQNIIDPRFYGIFLIIVGIIVSILRFMTTLPLDEK
jgi:uncharacterized membrane protein HdeD (DUF308 family)